MEHKHKYDESGNQLCCTQEKKIYKNADASTRSEHHHTQTTNTMSNRYTAAEYANEHQGEQGEDHEGHEHAHEQGSKSTFELFLPAILSLVFLLTGLLFDHVFVFSWFSGWIRIAWYILAYIPVGLPVIKEAWESILKGAFFSEFLLMSIATFGAFAIAEYPEAVAVMLFYAVGEVFQTLAVSKAKSNIKALLDERPDEVTVLESSGLKIVKAETVAVGSTIRLKPGEKLALDGELLTDTASFNTSALTGESKPDTKNKGDLVLAGMINLQHVVEVKITTAYADSKLSKILELVQNASSQKAPTELFIRKFAKVYTPIVVLLAVMICLLPYFFATDYQFKVWLYRALVFLVISCPCALVISIPLGYFGGIGAASRKGILFKGSNFLDAMATIKHLLMDKTGTMTEGVFKVQELFIDPSYNQQEILDLVNAIESHSSHPVASAIYDYVGPINPAISLTDVQEIPGLGLRGMRKDQLLLVGNFKLMDKFGIAYAVDIDAIVYTSIAIALDGKFIGYLTIADQIKADAAETIKRLHALGVKATMLSGDKNAVVQFVAKELGIDQAYGDLLPEDKVNRLKEIISRQESTAFVGDGVNDAPVVALSDVGIAMGGLGSDATIETADVVIQDDRPIKIPMAIQIGKKTKQIVWQNIGLAFTVKAIVLILGAGGLATMWEAVFADVGVALLAILNAIRIQRMNFD